MSRKTSPTRIAALLKALAETGNQSLACERAKVSRSWVQLHRSTDPEFDAEVRSAIETAKAHFDSLSANGEGERRPPSGWGFAEGEELVVKGTDGTGRGKRVQVARARAKQWTPRTETRFLTALSSTCNVKAACAAVGLTPASAYGHRRRWRTFRSRRNAAIERGYDRIEFALIEAGCNIFSPREQPPEVDLGPMRVADAIQVLQMHKHQVHGLGGAPGRWRPVSKAEIEATRARILHLLDKEERATARRKARAGGAEG
jgi:hypothetical protein